MAAGWIPKPTTGKTTPGPCAPNCHRWTLEHRPTSVIPAGKSHRDCEELRQQAASTCRLCGKPIGYETRMYIDPADDKPVGRRPLPLVHAACLEDAELVHHAPANEEGNR